MRQVVCESRDKRATLITVALINYTNKQQDFSAFVTFCSQGSRFPSPTHLCFFSGKIPSNVAARLTRKYWVPNFRHFVTTPPPPPPFFATIRHYSSLFATIRDYSPLFALFVLFVTIRCSVFATVRYSLFGFSRHPIPVTGRKIIQCIFVIERTLPIF